MGHTCYVLADIVYPMFSDDLEFIVLRQGPRLCDVYTNDMETTIICSTCKAMNSLQYTHTFDSGMMLTVRMSRFASHVTF